MGSSDLASLSLEEAVTTLTAGQLAVSEDAVVGRCLEARIALSIGYVLRDEALYLGSSCGQTLLSVCGANAPRELESERVLADMDLAAAVAKDVVAPGTSRSASIAAQVCQEAPGVANEIVRHVHSLLLAPTSAPLEELCERWRAIPLNWRRVTSPPTGQFASELKASPSGACEQHVAFTLHSEVFSGLFLLNSLLEHSCRPNLAPHWQANALHFVAVKDIPVGAHATMSYLEVVELALSGEERRRILRDTWHFDCRCERCQEDHLQMAPRDQPETPRDVSALHRWQTELEMFARASVIEDSQLKRCCAILNVAAKTAASVFGTSAEQGVLQLLFYQALLGDQAAGKELADAARRFHGADSPWSMVAHLLMSSPRDFLDQSLCEAEAAACKAGFEALAAEASARYRSDAINFGPQQVLGRLCRDGLVATSGRRVLHCGVYVAELPAQPISGGVVEHIERPVVASRVSGTAPGIVAVEPRRISRFKQQRQSEMD